MPMLTIPASRKAAFSPDSASCQMLLTNSKMYEAGYSLINMQNNHLYVIPGGGYDHLDTRDLYDNWEPNKFYVPARCF